MKLIPWHLDTESAADVSLFRQTLPDESDSQYDKHFGDRLREALNGQVLDDFNKGNPSMNDAEKNHTNNNLNGKNNRKMLMKISLLSTKKSGLWSLLLDS